MRTHRKIRIFLFMLAFGLASVQFFPFLYDKWTEIYVDLPKIESDSPILLVTKPTLTKEYIYKRSLISKDRDISQFANGGEFTNRCFGQNDETRCGKIGEIAVRKFIFNHWKEKRRAVIKEHWSATDTSGNIYIFVEPNENGRWQIILVQEYLGIQYADDNLRIDKATMIKFRKATKDNHLFEIGEYYLSFLNDNGEEIFRL